MSRTSERNHAHSYRSVHGSALEDPGPNTGFGDMRSVGAEIGNRPYFFLFIMTLSVGDITFSMVLDRPNAGGIREAFALTIYSFKEGKQGCQQQRHCNNLSKSPNIVFQNRTPQILAGQGDWIRSLEINIDLTVLDDTNSAPHKGRSQPSDLMTLVSMRIVQQDLRN